MEKVKSYINGVANEVLAQMPYTDTTDTVNIQILRTGDGYYYDFDNDIFVDTAITGTVGDMTPVGNTFGNITNFKASFTPTTTANYSIVCYNSTKDVPYTVDARSTGDTSTEIAVIEGDGLTTLEIFNLILDKLGQPILEAFPASISDMDDDHAEIFRFINVYQKSIATRAMWFPLLTEDEITLISGTATYDVPTNMYKPNKKSFVYDGEPVGYEEWDKRNQNRFVTYSTISKIYRKGTEWVVKRTPTSVEDGEVISFEYYAVPADLDIAYPNRKTWFPVGYDYDVLVLGVVAEIQSRRLQSESSISYAHLNGDKTIGILPPDGALDRMKQAYADSQHVNITMRGM